MTALLVCPRKITYDGSCVATAADSYSYSLVRRCLVAAILLRPNSIEGVLQQSPALAALCWAPRSWVPGGIVHGEIRSTVEVSFRHPDVAQRHWRPVVSRQIEQACRCPARRYRSECALDAGHSFRHCGRAESNGLGQHHRVNLGMRQVKAAAQGGTAGGAMPCPRCQVPNHTAMHRIAHLRARRHRRCARGWPAAHWPGRECLPRPSGTSRD